MSKYGIQTKGTGAVMGRSSYAKGGPINRRQRSGGPRTTRPSPTRPSPEARKKLNPRKKLDPKKKEKPSLILKTGVSEGPAKQNTTIKTFKISPKDVDGTNIKIPAKLKFANGGMLRQVKKPLKKMLEKLKERQTTKTIKPTPPRNKKSMGGRMNTSRMNRLEELGRVDAEKAYTSKGKRNLRDEKKRIVKEVAGR